MINYTLEDGIGTITMDDGKANAVSSTFVKEMNEALDKAESDKAKALILKGKEGFFSAGFDLKELQSGQEAQIALLKAGFEMLTRMFEYPRPIVAASNGHAIGMGAFLLFVSDTRFGARGEHKLSLPETKIGMVLNPLLLALVFSRVGNQHLTRTAIQSETLSPELGAEMGFLDHVVDASELDAVALDAAKELAALPSTYGANKRGVRASELKVMKEFLASFG